MQKIVDEIYTMAQAGMTKALANQDVECQKIFMDIAVKSGVLVEMLKNNMVAKAPEREHIVIGQNSRMQYDKISLDAKKDMLMVAYYFCLYDTRELYPYDTQDAAFFKAAEALHVKKNTLKNARDFFDGLVEESPRKGWDPESIAWKTRNLMDDVIEYWSGRREELRQNVKNLLNL